MSVIRLRKAQPKDAGRIRTVHRASVWGLCAKDYTKQQMKMWTRKSVSDIRQAMADGEKMILAISGRRVAGFGSVKGNKIYAVYVHPQFVRLGVGGLILKALEDLARRSGVSVIGLTSTLTAKRFYQTQGYRVVSPVRFQFGNSGISVRCFKMTKRLPKIKGTRK